MLEASKVRRVRGLVFVFIKMCACHHMALDRNKDKVWLKFPPSQNGLSITSTLIHQRQAQRGGGERDVRRLNLYISHPPQASPSVLVLFHQAFRDWPSAKHHLICQCDRPNYQHWTGCTWLHLPTLPTQMDIEPGGSTIHLLLSLSPSPHWTPIIYSR